MTRTCPVGLRKIRTVLPLCFALGLLAAGLVAGPAAAQNGVWEKWASDSFTLAPRESFQFHVAFDEIPVRSWKLVVDGGDMKCDLSVLRVRDESLIYYKIDEQRHEVLIPWGEGEEIMAVITARSQRGSFVVDLKGPPRDQVHAAYSYHVNRALEAYGSGQRLKAEAECDTAIRLDSDDGVAKVLLAGFLQARHYYTKAEVLVTDALAGELPGEMRSLAEDLADELAKLKAPLPAAVVEGVARAEDLLEAGKPAEALRECDDLLVGDIELGAASKSRIQTLRGRALDQLNRNFEAVDAFTQALHLVRNRASEAVIYFHMGGLYRKMENYQQAQGAYTMALNNGLPSGLEVQARESLKAIEKRLNE